MALHPAEKHQSEDSGFFLLEGKKERGLLISKKWDEEHSTK